MDTQIPKPTRHHHSHQRLVLPWKTRITLFFLNTFNDAARRRDGTINRRLFSLLDSFSLKTPPNPKPRNGVKTFDITVDPSRNLWFRLFVPCYPESESDPQLPIVVFFHGGGFVYLAPDFKAYDDVCRRFAREIPAVVVSVNYRLAPEYRYPAQYEDGFDVLKFLDEQSHILPKNADLSRCFLAGDSAGGNLAHHVTKRACESKFTHLKASH
ncbi:UNVERIFIED_CONTAM: putative carboxylesterase 18 [Sesamum indicum]